MREAKRSSDPKSYRDAVQTLPTSAPIAPAPASQLVEDLPLSPAQEAYLQQQFPARVLLSQAKFAASVEFWRFAVIGKCLGHDVSADSMEKALTRQWSDVGEWELFPMSFGFSVFRFSSQEARDSVLFGGPWLVDGAALALSPFDPDFRPTHRQVTRAVLWVRLLDLPPAYWSEELIADILSVIGKVVRLDDNTLNRVKGRYARAAVELDLRQPLLPGVTVGVEGGSPASFWQQFKYENVHLFCSSCRQVGHRSSSCSSTSSSTSSSASPSSESSAVGVAIGIDWVQHLLVRRQRAPPRRESFAPSRAGADPVVARHSRPDQPRGVHPGFPPAPPGPTTPRAAHAIRDVITSSGVEELPLPSSAGPCVAGLGGGLSSPLLSTSAFLLKPTEPLGSVPSRQATPQPAALGEDDGVATVGESAIDESRLIQEIMDDNSDHDDDDVRFTLVGKKQKGKAKMSSICLRPAPRDRTAMKRTKVASASSGKFSLLADLMNDLSAADLVAKYGPPP